MSAEPAVLNADTKPSAVLRPRASELAPPFSGSTFPCQSGLTPVDSN